MPHAEQKIFYHHTFYTRKNRIVGLRVRKPKKYLCPWNSYDAKKNENLTSYLQGGPNSYGQPHRSQLVPRIRLVPYDI